MIDHDTIEHAKLLVEQHGIDPLGEHARPTIIPLYVTAIGCSWFDAVQLAGIVIDGAARTRRSVEEWHAAEQRYDRLDRQHETRLDGAHIRRGR